MAHTGTDDFDTDLQEYEDEEYKSLEIKKGPNVYSCSLHTSLNFMSWSSIFKCSLCWKSMVVFCHGFHTSTP